MGSTCRHVWATDTSVELPAGPTVTGWGGRPGALGGSFRQRQQQDPVAVEVAPGAAAVEEVPLPPPHPG